jgi:2'-5' RNA ligase
MMSYADYLIIISPPDAVMKEIGRYKRASVNVIGHYEGMHSRAHISITHQTRCKPFLVQPAVIIMEKKLSTIAPVELCIKGFNFFNHGKTAKTIYAEIELTPETQKWFKLLKIQLGIKVKNFVPHITVAKNIPVTAFNKLWPKFANRSFNEVFTVNSLTILQRETYSEHPEWKVYKELFFANRLAQAF